MTSASKDSGSPFPTPEEIQSHFSRVAKQYDKSTSIITGKICRNILTLLDPPISSTSVVHDNGCGPGVMTRNIIETLSPDFPEIHATDLSPGMIEVLDGKGLTGVQTAVMDCQELTFPDGLFTHSICTFVIFAVPDAVKAAKEMYRTLQPGGVVAVTTWEDVGWIVPHQLAQKRVRPDEDWMGPLPAEWTTEGKLREVLEGGGFQNVEVSRDSSEFKLKDMFVGLKDMIEMATKQITKGWSEGEKERFAAVLKEELDKEMEGGEVREMKGFIAVARK